MNKTYKLFVTDLDGTLLDNNKNISRENLKALTELKKLGTEIMIATGRLDTMVKPYVKQLNIKTPVISCNGGLIRNIFTNETLYINDMEKKSVVNTIKICKKYNVPFLLYGEKTIYADSMSSKSEYILEYNKIHNNEDKIPFEIVDDIYEIIKRNEKLIKVLIITEQPNLCSQINNELSKIDNIESYKSDKILLDVMNKGVSKGNALKKYTKEKGIESYQIISIGDNYNDISMLNFTGLSIAVENAEDIVKKQADFITKDNNNHGVAHAIYKIINP